MQKSRRNKGPIYKKFSKIHGRKFRDAWKWIEQGDVRASDIVIERDENSIGISAKVRGDHGTYASYIGTDGFSCSCQGMRSRKVKCRHIQYLVLYCWFTNKISLNELLKLLE